ncbi:hypothetical protein ACJ41O_013733 [Fusarium nematophilum]
MQSTLPGPCEAVVSSVHGNAALSDGEQAVDIRHSSQGAIVSPKNLTGTSPSIGKVHFGLPTLRSLEEETPLGKLTGYAIASTALEIVVSCYDAEQAAAALQEHSRISRVDLFAGRDCLKSWDRESGEQQLPADRDLRLHVHSDIVGQGDNPFNENPKGLGVTLTIEFRGGSQSLLISSVALVQIVGSRGKGQC